MLYPQMRLAKSIMSIGAADPLSADDLNGPLATDPRFNAVVLADAAGEEGAVEEGLVAVAAALLNHRLLFLAALPCVSAPPPFPEPDRQPGAIGWLSSEEAEWCAALFSEAT